MEFRIPPILSAEKLMDKAFKRASKKEKRGRDRADTTKKTVSVKLNTVSKVLNDTLKRYEKEFPSIEQLPPFYEDIIDIIIGTDELKHSLGAMNWARRRIKRTLMEAVRELHNKEEIDEMNQLRKKAYGRTSSFLRQIDEELKFLEEAKQKLNSLPDIRTNIPTIAVAGYPNVGKSLLVNKLSSGKPKVDTYPFTTQSVGIGHFKVDHVQCQLIDTPGLLDRPQEDRNDIEMQAFKALENLADIIVFLYDPTETCGYFMESQEELADEIKKTFPNIEFIEVENKRDIRETDSNRLSISALEGDNLDELIDIIEEKINFIYHPLPESEIDVRESSR